MAFTSNVAVDIQKDVIDELEWDPEVDAAHVGVEVDHGVVTLTGTANSYSAYKAAERATFRVAGVRAVANEMLVKLAGNDIVDDAAIATKIADAFAANVMVPKGIHIRVVQGGVTLDGAVAWQYQRNVAEKTTRAIRGVKWVSNLIGIVQPTIAAEAIEAGITRALMRNAAVDAGQVHVAVSGREVTLTGTVPSWTERKEAEAAVWRAPGIIAVTNTIAVKP
jgi:osmotically-inducible protein OsmY